MAKKLSTDDVDYLIDSNIDIVRRRVYFTGEVDSKSILKVIKGLSILVKQSEEPVTLVLNSEGGNTSDAFGLYDYIVSLQVEVTIHVLGRCCSCAVLILQAGDRRTASPNSTFMIHRGTRADRFDMEMDIRADTAIAERMGITQKKLDGMQLYDNYFFSEKALLYKLIDEVVG